MAGITPTQRLEGPVATTITARRQVSDALVEANNTNNRNNQTAGAINPPAEPINPHVRHLATNDGHSEA